MTTSSSERCTRISPSAVLDDRLDGKDLEWARDHLRRCEACRERVEDFREMLLRVGRLPKATVGAAAMDEAYNASVPQRLRDEAGVRSYEISAPDTSRMVQPLGAFPSAIRPEVTSVPDLMSALEREIFRDEPAHPTPLAAVPDPIYPTLAPASDAEPAETAEPEAAIPDAAPTQNPENAEARPADEEVEEAASSPWRQVPIDSQWHSPSPPPPAPFPIAPPPEPVQKDLGAGDTDWARLLETIANAPEADDSAPEAEPAQPAAALFREPAAVAPEPELEPEPEPPPAVLPSPPPNRNVVYDEEPALSFAEEEPATRVAPAGGPSATVMRIAVVLGAAACVVIAALLYAGGYLLKPQANLSASRPTAAATHKASLRPSTSAKASSSPAPAPTVAAPTGTVLYTLGNGVTGNAVFRIRPGTAVAGYTRLVFDMHGTGLPTMVITQPDADHVQVTFKSTTVSGVAVNGIRSYQVGGIEPGVQTGNDGSFTIDLARPVRVTAFTLPATGGYAWRLVVDLHTS